jgi:hypothetical protein
MQNRNPLRSRLLVRICLGVAAAAGVGGGLAAHHAPTPVQALTNMCSPAVPKDGSHVCTNAARIGVTPDMVANAESFAECMRTQGVKPPVVVSDSVSITFVYLPGVVPSAAALAFCHANAVRVPIHPITPPNVFNAGPSASRAAASHASIRSARTASSTGHLAATATHRFSTIRSF